MSQYAEQRGSDYQKGTSSFAGVRRGPREGIWDFEAAGFFCYRRTLALRYKWDDLSSVT